MPDMCHTRYIIIVISNFCIRLSFLQHHLLSTFARHDWHSTRQLSCMHHHHRLTTEHTMNTAYRPGLGIYYGRDWVMKSRYFITGLPVPISAQESMGLTAIQKACDDWLWRIAGGYKRSNWHAFPRLDSYRPLIKVDIEWWMKIFYNGGNILLVDIVIYKRSHVACRDMSSCCTTC